MSVVEVEQTRRARQSLASLLSTGIYEMHALRYLQHYWHAVLDTLFPKQCVACGARGSYYCSKCIKAIENYRGEVSYSRIAAVRYDHQSPIARLIHLCKYDGVYDSASLLAELMAAPIREHSIATQAPLLVPVPLHKRRFRERGFNQSVLLSHALANIFGFEVADILIRHRFTRPQVELDGEERVLNVKNAFSLKKDAYVDKRRTYLLIDDVCTTGATLHECEGVLRAHGACNVFWAVIGHA